jgi:hypothetical protein
VAVVSQVLTGEMAGTAAPAVAAVAAVAQLPVRLQGSRRLRSGASQVQEVRGEQKASKAWGARTVPMGRTARSATPDPLETSERLV